MAPKWNTTDLIILVYFRSRGVLERKIDDLVGVKGGTRHGASKNYAAQLRRLFADEEKAGRPAMCDKSRRVWDLQVTDQWLVNQIVMIAKDKAKVVLGDEKQASRYYNVIKDELTSFGPNEIAALSGVSIERIQMICSLCADSSPQTQKADPIIAKLAWNVGFPAPPATATETNQGPSTSSSSIETHGKPTNESNGESSRASVGEQMVDGQNSR